MKNYTGKGSSGMGLYIIYIGIALFFIGTLVTLFLNRNIEVSQSGSFWEMPFRVQVGILCIILGILLICGGVMYGLITDPVAFLA